MACGHLQMFQRPFLSIFVHPPQCIAIYLMLWPIDAPPSQLQTIPERTSQSQALTSVPMAPSLVPQRPDILGAYSYTTLQGPDSCGPTSAHTCQLPSTCILSGLIAAPAAMQYNIGSKKLCRQLQEEAHLGRSNQSGADRCGTNHHNNGTGQFVFPLLTSPLTTTVTFFAQGLLDFPHLSV